jgi:hypothetical protein
VGCGIAFRPGRRWEMGGRLFAKGRAELAEDLVLIKRRARLLPAEEVVALELCDIPRYCRNGSFEYLQ